MNPEVKTLCDKITAAAEAYYLSEAIISDEEFDRLVDRLRLLDPNNPLLSQVGFFKVHGEATKLPYKIESSLPKCKSVKEVPGLSKEPVQIACTPKVDGLSCITIWEGGYLVQAITRGDGEYGVDITPKAKKIPDLQIYLEGFSGTIGGELYLRNDNFKKFFPNMANPRNTAVGLINSKSLDRIQHLSFAAFNYSHENGVLEVGESASKFFHNSAINNVFDHETHITGTVSEVDAKLLSIYNQYKDSNIPIDGLVIDGFIAWKAKTQEVKAIIDHIEWNVSYRARLNPVAVLREGVSLYGSTVFRATALNFGYVDKNKLGNGSEVMITKANEIIPQITQVLSESQFYTKLDKCPKCNGQIKLDGTFAYCLGSCVDKMEIAIRSFLETFYRPKGLSDMKPIINILNIKTPYDIVNHRTDYREILTKELGHRGELFSKVLDNSPSINRDMLIASLSLPALGLEMSRRLSPYLEELTSNISYELANKLRYKVINEPAFHSLVDNAWIIVKFYDAFRNRIYTPKPKSYKGKICLTGKMSKDRVDIQREFESYGYQVVDSVDNLTLLVCSDKNSQSSKMNKAKKLGIKILTEDEAREKLLVETLLEVNNE